METKSLLKPACLALSLVAAISAAQEASFPELPGCTRQNASRLPAAECGMNAESPIKISNELEFPARITIPEMEISACDATISIQYSQRNTVVRVEGSIENEGCQASSGSFVISARIRNAEGGIETLEFPQSWIQENGQELSVGGDFFVGENVDVVRVSALKALCKCADPAVTQ